MQNFDDFLKLGIEKSEDNSKYTHLDIMRNYLNDAEMSKIIKYLINELGFEKIS